MIKRITLFFLVLTVSVSLARADEQRDVSLSNDHSEETVTLTGQCNVFLSLAAISDESAQLNIAVENIRDDDNVLLLFGTSFSEKGLKALTPKITYDKMFGGTKNQRFTDCNRDLSGTIKIGPSDKTILLSKQVCSEKLIIRLPLYIAKYKGKRNRQLLLMEKDVVELNISVTLKPDEDFLQLTADINDFTSDLEKRPFCTHNRHKVGLSKQRQPYDERRKQMIDRIRDIQKRYYSTDREYKKYDSLRSALEKIDLKSSDYTTTDCGISKMHKPRKPVVVNRGHSCKYCALSLTQILHRLEDYYKKIYNRAVVKSAVESDVQALYNCCTASDCKAHSSAWKSGGSTKEKIVRYYKRIINR